MRNDGKQVKLCKLSNLSRSQINSDIERSMISPFLFKKKKSLYAQIDT